MSEQEELNGSLCRVLAALAERSTVFISCIAALLAGFVVNAVMCELSERRLERRLDALEQRASRHEAEFFNVAQTEVGELTKLLAQAEDKIHGLEALLAVERAEQMKGGKND